MATTGKKTKEPPSLAMVVVQVLLCVAGIAVLGGLIARERGIEADLAERGAITDATVVAVSRGKSRTVTVDVGPPVDRRVRLRESASRLEVGDQLRVRYDSANHNHVEDARLAPGRSPGFELMLWLAAFAALATGVGIVVGHLRRLHPAPAPDRAALDRDKDLAVLEWRRRHGKVGAEEYAEQRERLLGEG
ncbi:hypothetical protein [Longispora urticae]